jgi:hypothetical protein
MAKHHLGTFKPPPGFSEMSEVEKRAYAKHVADLIRERAGLPPTDADGNAPQISPDDRSS